MAAAPTITSAEMIVEGSGVVTLLAAGGWSDDGVPGGLIPSPAVGG